jgi:short-subunit dehydrogenase
LKKEFNRGQSEPLISKKEGFTPQGKIAWITGGGTGIGAAVAKKFHGLGYHVVISGRRREVLDKTAALIMSENKCPGFILALEGDVTDISCVSRIHSEIVDKMGSVDLLINNAGSNYYCSWQDSDAQTFLQAFESNCISSVLCIKQVLPFMLEKNRGAIVNISSMLGKWATPYSPSYSVSKYAVAGLTDSIRQQLANTEIHIMGVYPGLINTDMTQQYLLKDRFLRRWIAREPVVVANSIVQGLKWRKRNVCTPWYVSFILAMHCVVPNFLESIVRIYNKRLNQGIVFRR